MIDIEIVDIYLDVRKCLVHTHMLIITIEICTFPILSVHQQHHGHKYTTFPARKIQPTLKPTFGPTGVHASLNPLGRHRINSKDTSEDTTNCPVRNIIKTLHDPLSSTFRVNSALKQLGSCKVIYLTSVPKCSTQTVFRVFENVQDRNHFQTVNWVHIPYPAAQSTAFYRNITSRPVPSIHRRESSSTNLTRFGFP